MQKQTPTYSLLAAITIDGKIAKNSSHSSDWTSSEDKEFLHRHLRESDCVVVGRKTFEVAKEPLSKRNCLVFTSSVDNVKKETNLLTYINPKNDDLAKYIKESGYKKVAILGGTQVYNFFLENNLIDNIYLTIEPIVFGKGLSIFNTQKSLEQKFNLVSLTTLNDKGSVLIHYDRK